MYCPKDRDHDVVMVEYGYGNKLRYDGVSEIQCHDCEKRYCRWCKQELSDDELAPRNCDGVEHPRINR